MNKPHVRAKDLQCSKADCKKKLTAKNAKWDGRRYLCEKCYWSLPKPRRRGGGNIHPL
jgi:hypothetical protein